MLIVGVSSDSNNTTLSLKKLNVANLQVITDTGTPVSINVLIVPSIATPLENTVKTPVLKDLSYLRGLQLAHPVTKSDSFEISLLIGADHYWDCVGDHTVCGNGPTAVSSKLGYLLSGPISSANPQQPGNITNSWLPTIHKKRKIYNICGPWNLLAFHQLHHSIQTNNFSKITLQPLSPDVLMDLTWEGFHGNNNTLHCQLTSIFARRGHIH